MQRFFLSRNAIRENTVTFPSDISQQLTLVLRLRSGDHVVVLDSSGTEYDVELTETRYTHATGLIQSTRFTQAEPITPICLYHALLKGKKIEVVLQKCTEIGVTEFVPILTERCVQESTNDLKTAKYDRWRAIIREAAEQSGRGRLPNLEQATGFELALRRAQESGGLMIIAWEGERKHSLRDVLREASRPILQSINVFIGPEGGLTPREVDTARTYGAIPATLGPRILRAETAPIVVAANIVYELGT
jgi:16S rRNA (uracil1498-N3)-methyltransferase